MVDYIGTRWMHVNTWYKTGSIYVINDICRIEKTNTEAFLYCDESDSSIKWVRPIEEFLDGRFIRIKNGYLV